MALTERLALLISLDANGAVRGLENVGKAADRNLGKAESRIDKTAQRMQKAGVGMLAASGIAATGLYKAGQAAADLEQAVGGTEAVFKDTGAVIDKFAKDAASNMGLSERAFREATTGLGGQLKGLGFDLDEAADKSIELTGIAADLSATYGGTTAEAVQALGAAFRGEADPAERFNLFLNQTRVNAKAVELGLAANTSEVDANAKAQATLALITEQSADAQGQFARETGTAAGQMQIASAEFENAKAALGESIAPIMADVAGALADVSSGFSGLNEKTDGALSKVVAFGTIGLGALGGLSFVTGKLLEMRDTFRPLTDRIYAAETGFTKLGDTLQRGVGFAAATAGVVALADSLLHLVGVRPQDLSNLSEELELLALTAKETGSADLDDLTAAIDAIVDPSLYQSFSGSVDAISGQIATLGGLLGEDTTEFANWRRLIQETDDSLASFVTSGNAEVAEDLFARITSAVEASGGSAEDAAAAFPDYAAALDLAAARAGDGEATFLGYGAALDVVRGDAEAASGPVGALTEETEESAEAADEAGEAYSRMADKLRGLFDPLFAAADAMNGVEEAQEAIRDSQESLSDAQSAYNEAVKEYGSNSEEARDAMENVTDAQYDLDRAQRGALEAAIAEEAALYDLRAEMENGNTTFDEAIGKLEGFVAQGKLTEEQAARVKDELGKVAYVAALIPRQIDIGLGMTLNLDQIMYQLAIAKGAVDKFNAENGTNISPYRGPGAVTAADGGLVPDAKYLATGGPSGTDTVPAWLTPGEFVMRRSAVDRLGAGYLASLNSGGAGQAVGNHADVTIINNYPTPDTVSESTTRSARKFAAVMG